MWVWVWCCFLFEGCFWGGSVVKRREEGRSLLSAAPPPAGRPHAACSTDGWASLPPCSPCSPHACLPACSVQDQNPEGKYEALTKYGRDLTQAAREGKLDPVIGR